MCVALCVVPQQLGEKLEHIFEDEVGSYPQIRVRYEDEEEMYEIVVEGLAICECGDLVTGFGLMMAAYYIFNLAYPKVLTGVLTFYQKVFLGMTDNTKNAKVSALICKLSD